MTLTLRARENPHARVELVYHGKDADPKITIDVTENPYSPTPQFTRLVPPRDDLVNDYFEHPFVYFPTAA